jgi:hypothetical protein
MTLVAILGKNWPYSFLKKLDLRNVLRTKAPQGAKAKQSND